MESSSDNDVQSGKPDWPIESVSDSIVTECISEAHLQFMRDYVAREEKLAKATVDRFLTTKLKQKGKVCQID
jgi:hypothetical protein